MGLKIAVHRLFRKIGYDFRRYHSDNFPGVFNRIKIINKQNINLVLDIGASEGCMLLAREAGYKGRIISFEPLGESFKLLNQKSDKDILNGIVSTLLLGESDGEVEMNVSDILPVVHYFQ